MSIKNKNILEQIAKLLGIADPAELESEIVNKGAMDGIKIRTPEKPETVGNQRDSLAKSIYDKLFNWLVAKLNLEILPDELKSGDKYEEE